MAVIFTAIFLFIQNIFLFYAINKFAMKIIDPDKNKFAIAIN